MQMNVENKKSKITTWKPKTKDELLVTSDGKLFIIFFEKLFNAPQVEIYDRFFIKKGSYEKQLEIICEYINFFMNFYDPEHEMATAYLKIKFALDKEKRFTADNPNELIDLIYEILFTDSIISKINQLVDDNYLDDIESTEDSKKYATKEKKHLESLEFTNKHIKILLRISFGMKCIAPILFHYVFNSVIKLDKDSELIYSFYRRLFDIFSDDVNMYNKLFVYVKAKVLESKSHNGIIFEQRDILGIDEYSVIRQFLHRVLISENMVKYRFNKEWNPKTKKYRENIIGFNKTIIKYQLVYFLKDQYSKNLTEVTSTKNSDGLSGMDMMEMNLSKLDEGLIVLAQSNVETEIERIRRDNDFDISEEEIDYYVKNHTPSKLQANLVFSYWSKYFGAYRNTNEISRRSYIILLLILKRKLLLEAGYNTVNPDDEEHFEYSKLPYILTGNLQDKVVTRIIRNSKFTSKISESYLYDKIKSEKYSNLCKIKEDYIILLLSQIINTTFTYVVYEHPEMFGKEIVYDDNKISDELLFFINSI